MTKNDKVEDRGKSKIEGTETPFERFQNLTRRVVSVPKSEVERRDAEWRKRKNKSNT